MTGLRGAAAAEWTKLWSLRSTWWCLLVALVVTGVQAGSYGISFVNGAVPGYGALLPVGETAREAVQASVLVLLAVPVLTATAEYATGSIAATLLWVPRRGRVVLAKAAVVAGVTGVAGVVLGLFGVLAGWLALGPEGLVEAPALALDVLAVGAYVALVSTLALGVGLAVRSAVGTLTVVFLLLFVLPALLPAVGLDVLVRAADYLPGTAGGHLLGRTADPYPAAVAIAVLVGWAVAALLAGALVLHRRDA